MDLLHQYEPIKTIKSISARKFHGTLFYYNLTLNRYVETEVDCTLALSLDPTYTKAYLRRGTARLALNKIESAVKGTAVKSSFFLIRLTKNPIF